MKDVAKLKLLIGLYTGVLSLLLLCVAAMPMLIHQGLVTQRFIIEEDTLESILIVILLGIFLLSVSGFRHLLQVYGRKAAMAGEDKSRLVSRLTDAFQYIGTVNQEMKEMHELLKGVRYYPQTRKELKKHLHILATQAMAFADVPWIVVRMIDRHSGRTIQEHAVEKQKGVLPSIVMGNRAILEERMVEGVRTIRSTQKNLLLTTVCIMPVVHLSEEANLMVTVLTNQMEGIFLLSRDGTEFQRVMSPDDIKEIPKGTPTASIY